MLRAFGKATARMRSTANEFRNQFNEALKEAELEDVKNIVDEARKLDPRSKLTQVFDPIRSAGEDIRAGLQSTTSMSPAEPAKFAEVTTPVEPNGATVPVEAPVEKPKAPRKKAAPAAALETPVAETPVKAKPRTAKPKAVVAKSETVAKPAAPKPAKVAAAKKPAVAKATTTKVAAPAKKTTKKTTDKTGSKA